MDISKDNAGFPNYVSKDRNGRVMGYVTPKYYMNSTMLMPTLCPEFSARTPLEAENSPPSGLLAERMDYLRSSRSA
eukprot:scaffold58118_cov37-Cyclotella_meneghiniana.AAC.2